MLVFIFLYMKRLVPILVLFLVFQNLFAQREPRLPADFRQHNLTTYNASLFNPAFSLDRNNPESVAFWARWQWQNIDADPSTLFLNYSRKLGDNSAVGAAFFQQNTGVFFDTGGVLNYAYKLNFSPLVKMALGVNVFGFKQTLADDRYQPDPNLPIPQPTVTDDFILQMAPGVSLSVERLTLSVASENLFDYNFTANESNTRQEDKVFMSLLSYDFPVALGDLPTSFLRPSMYLRTIPGQANQVGFYTLLNTNKYWGQVGYNNFYGFAVGGGATFFKHLSLGASVELGINSSLTKDPSFEIIAAYFLGKPDERHKVVGFEVNEKEDGLLKLGEEQYQLEATKKEAEEIAKEEALREQQEQARKLDSITRAEQAEALATVQKLEEQRRQDSLAQIKIEEAEKIKREAEERARMESAAADKPKEGEKYEEVKTEDGLQAGYYLIANVFGTKKYLNAFMADLRRNGLRPKSFLRSKNNYDYVYLERYDTMQEARRARDTNFEGKYAGKIWIFRVVGE